MNVKGHLSEYPLSDLLSILLSKRETGRLKVDFEREPGIFHLKDGRILDAAVGSSKGPDAIRMALSMKEAPFDFDDTVIAGKGTINESQHQAIISLLSGLLPYDDEDEESILLNSASVTGAEFNPPASIRAVPENIQDQIILAVRETVVYARRHTLAIGTAGILMLLVPIVVAMAVSVASKAGSRRATVHKPESNILQVDPANSLGGGAKQADKAEPPADAVHITAEKPKAIPQPTVATRRVSTSSETAELGSPKEPAVRSENVVQQKASSKVIAVVMHIEGGRISEAYVKDHHPGLEAFEATAIRLARQRRYSEDKAGTETIFVTVSKDQ